MRQTKTILSILLLTLFSCQSQTNTNQPATDSIKSNTETQSLANKQENTTGNISPQPRFSIFQSTLAAKGTYKLDTYTETFSKWL